MIMRNNLEREIFKDIDKHFKNKYEDLDFKLNNLILNDLEDKDICKKNMWNTTYTNILNYHDYYLQNLKFSIMDCGLVIKKISEKVVDDVIVIYVHVFNKPSEVQSRRLCIDKKFHNRMNKNKLSSSVESSLVFHVDGYVPKFDGRNYRYFIV